MKSIRELRGQHPGEDIYVLGSGGSLNFLDRCFFDGKVTVAVNSSARAWGLTPSYVVVKEHREEADPNLDAFPNTPVVISRYIAGGGASPGAHQANFSHPNAYVFDHLPNEVAAFQADRHWPADPDMLVVSWSTITSAMHFAAYLGAKNIILVAHDCGQVGDNAYVNGYGAQADLEWLMRIESQSLDVRQELERRYGVRVYSLSPFLTPNLDGVPYLGRNRINLP